MGKFFIHLCKCVTTASKGKVVSFRQPFWVSQTEFLMLFAMVLQTRLVQAVASKDSLAFQIQKQLNVCSSLTHVLNVILHL